MQSPCAPPIGRFAQCAALATPRPHQEAWACLQHPPPLQPTCEHISLPLAALPPACQVAAAARRQLVHQPAHQQDCLVSSYRSLASSSLIHDWSQPPVTPCTLLSGIPVRLSESQPRLQLTDNRSPLAALSICCATATHRAAARQQFARQPARQLSCPTLAASPPARQSVTLLAAARLPSSVP
jgi:hypothetical protein